MERSAVKPRRRLQGFALGVVLGLASPATGAPDGNSCPEADPNATTPPNPDRTCIPTRPLDHSLAPDLAVLKSPEAPAFAALDLTPTAISRPSTPTGAALALATGLSNGVLTPGQNVALDFAPYWLVAHPKLTATQLEEEWWRFDRRLSVSLASTTGKIRLPDAAGIPVDTNVGRVAMGLRTTLIRGHVSDAAAACGRVVDDFTGRDVELVAKAETAFVEQWEKEHPRPQARQLPDVTVVGKTSEEAKKALDERAKAMDALNADFIVDIARWSNDLAAAIKVWRNKFEQPPGSEVLECMDVLHHRNGLMVDAAVAEILNFPGNDISALGSSGSRDLIVWATGGYTLSWGPNRPGGGHAWDLSALGLLKRDWEHVARASGTTRTQFGVRGVLAFERWGLSAEGLSTRVETAGMGGNVYRVSGTVDYHLKSGMWLTLTGGAALDKDGKPSRPIGLASFQANFGHDRLLSPDAFVSRPTGSTP